MIKPYYEKDGITIYCCDCREVLPFIGEFDLCLTDPPYGDNWNTDYSRFARGTSDKTAIITGKVETVTVIETWLNPRDGGRTFIKVQDPCGREWKAYGSLCAGDDYSDFTVLEKSAGRGGFAKGMRK